jgi:hypothetical protein
MPSPTMATVRPPAWSRLMTSTLPAITSSMPASAATARGALVVAGEQNWQQPEFAQAADGACGGRFNRVGHHEYGAGLAVPGHHDRILKANLTDGPLADLINAADPVQAWADTPLGSKRILIDRLMTVTILPIGRAGRGFYRSSVRIDPKHPLGAPG